MYYRTKHYMHEVLNEWRSLNWKQNLDMSDVRP